MGNMITQRNESDCQSQESKDYNLQMKYCFFKLLQHRDWKSVQKAIGSNPILAAQRDPLGCTTLHMTCSLNPTMNIISTIYNAFPDAVKMTDGQGRLPIHVAVIHGAHASIIRSLLSYFPESVNIGDYRGQLPLHHLLLWHTTPGNNHPNAHPNNRYEYHSPFPLETFHLLLQADSNGSMIRKRDRHGYTALSLAWESYRSVVQWNSQELEERKDLEWEKLQTIIYASHHPTFSHFHISSPSNFKIVHAAVEIGDAWLPLDCFRLLLDKFPEQIMQMNDDGNLPLHLALNQPLNYSINSTPTILQILLQIYPNAAQIPYTNNQRLPLHMALVHGREWNQGIQDLFLSYPEALTIKDPVTGVYPFLMPFFKKNQFKEQSDNTIETIYHLLQADPSVLSQYCTCTTKT